MRITRTLGVLGVGTVLISAAAPISAKDTGAFFSDLAIARFRNGNAVHTHAKDHSKYVYIYCKNPGATKGVTVTLLYHSSPPSGVAITNLEDKVSTTSLSVTRVDGKDEPINTMLRNIRTYHTDAGLWKTDIDLQFADTEFEKLKTATALHANVAAARDLSHSVDFEIHGPTQLLGSIASSCVN